MQVSFKYLEFMQHFQAHHSLTEVNNFNRVRFLLTCSPCFHLHVPLARRSLHRNIIGHVSRSRVLLRGWCIYDQSLIWRRPWNCFRTLTRTPAEQLGAFSSVGRLPDELHGSVNCARSNRHIIASSCWRTQEMSLFRFPVVIVIVSIYIAPFQFQERSSEILPNRLCKTNCLQNRDTGSE